MARGLVVLPIGAYRILCRVYTWLHHIHSFFLRGLDQRTALLDLRCISWTLQISLEIPVHLSALEHLATITQFTNFDPTLVMDCFNIFVGWINVSNRKVVIIQGLEQFATVSAGCFFHTLRHLSATHPTSSVLADLRQRYHQIFPFETDFRGLPFYYTVIGIHALAGQQGWNFSFLRWTDYEPSTQEITQFAQHMVYTA